MQIIIMIMIVVMMLLLQTNADDDKPMLMIVLFEGSPMGKFDDRTGELPIASEPVNLNRRL